MSNQQKKDIREMIERFRDDPVSLEQAILAWLEWQK